MRHPTDGLLLSTIIERYCAENPDNQKPSTMNTWTFHLRAFGRRLGCLQDPVTKRLSGGPTAAEVGGRHCLDFCLLDADRRPRTASTARAYKTALVALFRWAADPDAHCPCNEDPTCRLPHRALLPLDPTSRLAKELPLEEVDEKHWLTADERDSIFAELDTGTPRDWRDTVVMELYFGTGRRKAEVPRLKWRDVNLAGESIKFMTKGRQRAGKPIHVPMSEDLKETLLAWRDDYRAGLRAAGWDDLRIQRDFPDLPVVCRLYHHAPDGIGRPGMELRILWGRPSDPRGSTASWRSSGPAPASTSPATTSAARSPGSWRRRESRWRRSRSSSATRTRQPPRSTSRATPTGPLGAGRRTPSTGAPARPSQPAR